MLSVVTEIQRSLKFLALDVFSDRKARQLKSKIGELESLIQPYQDYRQYLRRRFREQYLSQSRQIEGALHRLILHRLLPSSTTRRNWYNRSLEKISAVQIFLTSYVQDYVEQCARSHKAFFSRIRLDPRQIEAVVKDEEYNIVIAPAGSGKTKVLTTRIAFQIMSGKDPLRILALAYTTKAAEEMESRLYKDFGISSVEVKTFHSYGREVASKYSPKFRTGVLDQDEQRDFVQKTITELLKNDGDYATLALNYAVTCNTFEADSTDFPDPKEYYEFMKRQRYTTLNGRRVNSIAERDIGNFLFLNQVEFKYGSEARVKWAPSNRRFRDYQPDFLLPDYDGLCIEHWAFGRDGLVPSWFSPIGSAIEATREYQQKVDWKKRAAEAAGQTIIETFNYQWYEGTVLNELKKQLLESKVTLKEISLGEILEKLKETMPRRDNLVDSIVSFLNNAKTNCLTISQVKQRTREKRWTTRQRLLARLTIPVWERYEEWLISENKLDFNDMITFSVDALRTARVDTPLIILIDEFQDITNSQVELIKLLKGKNEETTVFCVGDDWQSIFSFAGSDVNNIVHFEEKFSHVEKTFLNLNYRCPKNIVDLSNLVMSYNKSRQAKEVVPSSSRTVPVEQIRMPVGEKSDYDSWEIGAARKILQEIMKEKTPEESIIVLSRNNWRKNNLEIKCLDITDQRTSFLTIHVAKGKEADYVLLLGCISGKFGFPSEYVNGNEIDIARAEDESLAANERIEEERRLLYVAMTRCKKKLFIFSSEKSESRFISELEPQLRIDHISSREEIPAIRQKNTQVYNYHDVLRLGSGSQITIKELLWLPKSSIREFNHHYYLSNSGIGVKDIELSKTCYNSYHTLANQKAMRSCPHTVYVIECNTPHHFYIGMTADFKHRISVLKSGRGGPFTQRHGIKSVVHTQQVSDRDKALEVVKYLRNEYKMKYGKENVF